MSDHFEDGQYRFWWRAYIVVLGVGALLCYLSTLTLTDGRSFAFVGVVLLALVLSGILGGIAALFGWFLTGGNLRWHFRAINAAFLRAFNAVFLSCFLLFFLLLFVASIL